MIYGVMTAYEVSMLYYQMITNHVVNRNLANDSIPSLNNTYTVIEYFYIFVLTKSFMRFHSYDYLKKNVTMY